MQISNEKKSDLIKKYSKSEKDTGSSEVQIAILTERIKNLTEHMKDHIHDFHSRRGLLMMVGKRKRLLKYLQKKDKSSFINLTDSLNIRRSNLFEASA